MALNKENFKQPFGSWYRHFEKFIETKAFSNIYDVLKSRSAKGIRTAPLAVNTFKAFEYCDYDNLKAIFVGFCPYHTFRNGIPVADGLMMSTSGEKTLQPSLEQWYQAQEQELYDGLNLSMVKDNNMKFLADQGVLLYNCALTTQEGKAGSDVELWAKFNQYFFEEIINKYQRGLPIIFYGNIAAKSEKLVSPFLHYTKIVTHPASASYKGTSWDSEGLFTFVNKILLENNDYQIQWDNQLNPF